MHSDRDLIILLSGEYMPLGSVLSQHRFGVMDIKYPLQGVFKWVPKKLKESQKTK